MGHYSAHGFGQRKNASRPAHATDTAWAQSPRRAYVRGCMVARSPAARRWSWRRGVLPGSKRAARGWQRARRQMEWLTAVGHRQGGGGGFKQRGCGDDKVRRWPAAVGEGSCDTGEQRGRLGTRLSSKCGKVLWCSL
jgi:hypothetical protein